MLLLYCFEHWALFDKEVTITTQIFAPWKLGTLLQLYSHDGEIELDIFNKEHTDTFWKKLQASINSKNWAICRKNSVEIFHDMKLNNKNKNNNNINSNMKENSKNNSDSTQKENPSKKKHDWIGTSS